MIGVKITITPPEAPISPTESGENQLYLGKSQADIEYERLQLGKYAEGFDWVICYECYIDSVVSIMKK